MKQKPRAFNRYVAGMVVFFILAVTAAIVMLRHTTTEAAAGKPAVGAAVPSKFTTTGAKGWWQGATSKTDMALFQDSHECFTSVQYHTGKVDIVSELQKLSVSQAGPDGGSTPGAVLPVTLQTGNGKQRYSLHQYALTGGSGDQLMRGLELGYLRLSDGYIKVEGHCNTPGQLPATISALQSVVFDESK